MINKLYTQGDIIIACLSLLKSDVQAANMLISRFKYILLKFLDEEARRNQKFENLKLI